MFQIIITIIYTMKSNYYKKSLSLVIGLVLCISSSYAQNNSPEIGEANNTPASDAASTINTDISSNTVQDNAEAGSYTRKSITFIDNLWSLDGSVKNIPDKWGARALKGLHSSVMVKRFDYNVVSDRVMERFTQSLQGGGTRSLRGLTKVLEKSLAPEIVAVLNAQKEMRAEGLTTGQQQNSFMTDKAKELGYTIQEINQVMNSAYIYLPLAGKYVTVEEENVYLAKIQLGVAWYKIEVNEGDVSVRFFTKTVQNVVGVANKSSLGLKKPRRAYIAEAHESMIRTAVQSLEVAMKSIPAFSISGQIMEKDFWSIGVDVGFEEGISLDDKYLLIQQVENESGEIENKEIGWTFVTEVADTSRGSTNKNENNGYISQARIVSGSPLQGDVIREHPRLPVDLYFGWRQYAGQLKSDLNDSVLVDASGGIFFEAHYNFGRSIGFNQLFLALGLGFGFSDDTKLNEQLSLTDQVTTILANYDFSIMKKFYVNRLAFKGQGGVSVGGLYMSNDSADYNIHAVSVFGAGGVDIALSPSFNLSIMARYDLGAPTETKFEYNDNTSGALVAPEYDPTGLAIEAGLVWSLPSLGISFTDIFKLASGI